MEKYEIMNKKVRSNKKGITLIALIITIIVLLILAGVALNSLVERNGIINTTQDTVTLSNIKTLEEGIDLYKTGQHLENKTGEEAYPLVQNDDGTYVTLSQMKTAEELSKIPDEVKYILLNMSSTKIGTDIPTLEDIDYTKFYKLDASKLNITEAEAENLVMYIEGDKYKVINLAGVTLQGKTINVIIPLKNEEDPEYIATANNTYKLYGDGTVKVIGQKSAISGITEEENAANNGIQELDLERINSEFGNKMALPEKRIYISLSTIYVIDQNDDLWAWGDNSYNKLGQGNSYLVTEPTKILEGRTEGVTGVKAKNVWAGYSNTFVVDTENRIWVCGTNTTGALGQGDTNIYNNFVQVIDLNGELIEEVAISYGAQNQCILVRCSNGEVYGVGSNEYGQLGIGNTTNQTKYVCLSNYDSNIKNVKKIQTNGVTSSLLKENGELYGVGYNDAGELGLGDFTHRKNWTKRMDNVEDIITVRYIKDIDGNVYVSYNATITKFSNIEANSENKLFGQNNLISNGKIYTMSTTSASIYATKYPNPEPTDANNTVFKSNGKIYVGSLPNITHPKGLSNYELRKVLDNAIFMNGTKNDISIVNRNGEIYENLVKNTELKDIQKLIISGTSRYAITKDNRLYAKGNERTGMWGSYTSKNKYVEVTKDGTNIFDNVKNLFTSQFGGSAIFTTLDNKIYWAGATSLICLPNIKGDIPVTGIGTLTEYPKEVTSNVLDSIKDKIKDIKYSFIHEGGVKGKNTLIITEDGKLYTMSSNRNMAGNNTVSSDFTELIIKEGTTVEAIATAKGLSIAILSNGEVYGWGYNTYGLLGKEYNLGEIYPTPVKLSLPNNIKYISLGDGFAIFASKTGEVYGIGQNDYGQLGTGDNIGRNEFVRCPELEK